MAMKTLKAEQVADFRLALTKAFELFNMVKKSLYKPEKQKFYRLFIQFLVNSIIKQIAVVFLSVYLNPAV